MSFPQPSGDFEWVQESWGAALRCRPLDEVAQHCFSTRDLALEGTRDEDATHWTELARALGLEIDGLVRMRQVHCADVYVAGRAELPPAGFPDWPEADIAVTDDPSMAVSVRAADCVPTLLADRRSGAVAAIHAGWKGTAAGAVMVAVKSLASKYDVQPRNVIAAIGPSIGPCCYDVGPELADQFASQPDAASWFTNDAKPHLDLWRATRDQLVRAGVPPQQIHLCRLCTFDHPALFHSYRRDGKNAGRLVAAIRSARGRTP